MVDEDCGNLKYCLYEIENSKCLPCIPTDMVGRQLVLSFVVATSYYNQCLCFKYSITSHDEPTDDSHFPSNGGEVLPFSFRGNNLPATVQCDWLHVKVITIT